MKFSPFALATALCLTGAAQAATVATLQFADVARSESLSFDNVAGAALSITPQAAMSDSSTTLRVVVSDIQSREGQTADDEAIGVQVFKTLGDGRVRAIDGASIDHNQSLLFNFSKSVTLASFNMDHGAGMGGRLFSIFVDGGGGQSFKLDGSDWLATGLTGRSFRFGAQQANGASFSIDSVGFSEVSASQQGTPGHASPLPEPSVYASVGLSAGLIIFLARRRRQRG